MITIKKITTPKPYNDLRSTAQAFFTQEMYDENQKRIKNGYNARNFSKNERKEFEKSLGMQDWALNEQEDDLMKTAFSNAVDNMNATPQA